jgi:hypothetical protein
MAMSTWETLDEVERPDLVRERIIDAFEEVFAKAYAGRGAFSFQKVVTGARVTPSLITKPYADITDNIRTAIAFFEVLKKETRKASFRRRGGK